MATYTNIYSIRYQPLSIHRYAKNGDTECEGHFASCTQFEISHHLFFAYVIMKLSSIIYQIYEINNYYLRPRMPPGAPEDETDKPFILS